MHTAIAHINRSALRHNLQRVREVVPGHPVMVMLKANGYGHGLIEAAKAFSNADAFGVARLHEAVELREAGFQQRILLLEGFLQAEELALLSELELESVVHQAWQVEALQQAQLHHPIRIWVKADTGMHRIGFLPEQVPQVFADLACCPCVQSDIQLMSHFACADDTGSAMTAEQLDCFTSLIYAQQEVSPNGELSIANSAAILTRPEAHLGWLRPGIMLYGANPMLDGVASDFELQPAMTLSSRVMAIRELEAGEPVGYGATWRAEKNTRLAVVAIGYGDGYPRHAKNGTPVLINGQRFELAGRVSMDMITVDIGDAQVKVGDSVELWGENLSADEVARHAGTISYELFCGITKRVVCHYI